MPVTQNPGDYLKYKITVSHLCWRAVQEKYPNHKELGLDYWTVRKILSDLGDLIVEEVYDNPEGFALPYTLGTLMMIGRPTKTRLKYRNKRIDYARTGNVIYGMYWLTSKSKVKKINFYKFKTAKLVQRDITRVIRNDRFFKWLVVPEKRNITRLDY